MLLAACALAAPSAAAAAPPDTPGPAAPAPAVPAAPAVAAAPGAFRLRGRSGGGGSFITCRKLDLRISFFWVEGSSTESTAHCSRLRLTPAEWPCMSDTHALRSATSLSMSCSCPACNGSRGR